MVKISIIAAIGKNRELGKDNKLLWHIPEDFKRFKEITSGHPIIMGRKTFESIGHPLPNRTNIIITRQLNNKIENVITVHSLEEALKMASSFCHPELVSGSRSRNEFGMTNSQVRQDKLGEIFIIGGGQIFQQAIGIADKLYLTIVDSGFDADTFFPDYSDFKKNVFDKNGESNGYKYWFIELER